MEVPSKPVDVARPLCDQCLAMGKEEADLAVGPVEVCRREVRLTKRSSRNSQGVDGVGLAEGSRQVTAVRHQLRRHSHNCFSSAKQVSLEPPREMAAVLDRPEPRASEALGPFEQREVVRASSP